MIPEPGSDSAIGGAVSCQFLQVNDAHDIIIDRLLGFAEAIP